MPHITLRMTTQDRHCCVREMQRAGCCCRPHALPLHSLHTKACTSDDALQAGSWHNGHCPANTMPITNMVRSSCYGGEVTCRLQLAELPEGMVAWR